MTTPQLKFRFLKNETIDLGQPTHIPVSFREQQTALTQVVKVADSPPRLVNVAVLPVYDFGPNSHIHTLELRDETPRFTRRAEGASDEMHTKLRERAIEKAIENKEHNDALRAKVEHYVKCGTLEIVEDTFAPQYEDAPKETTHHE